MERIAVSISHEAEYAVAIAFGIRMAGGRFLFPPDIEERLDDRERRILARMERLRPPWRPSTGGRSTADVADAAAGRRDGVRQPPARLQQPRGAAAAGGGGRAPASNAPMDDRAAAALLPERPARGHKGTFGKVLAIAGSLDYAGAALLVCRAAGRGGAGLVTLAVPESLQPLFAAKVVEATTMALPEDDVEEVDPEPAIARILDHDHDAIVLGPGLRPGLATDRARPACSSRRPEDEPDPAPMVLDAEALRSMATLGEWWSGRRPAVRAHARTRRVRAAARGIRRGVGPATATSADDDEARSEAAAKAAARGLGPGRRPQGREDGDRRARRDGHGRAVREPRAGQRRHRRRALGGHRRRCSRRA